MTESSFEKIICMALDLTTCFHGCCLDHLVLLGRNPAFEVSAAKSQSGTNR